MRTVDRYRLVVTGRADRGAGIEPYTVASEPFRDEPAKLAATAPVIADGVARFRVTYPSPGEGAVMALPRLVTEGEATLRVTRANGSVKRLRVRPGADGVFAASVADATAPVVEHVEDGCGNSSAP